MISHHQVTPFLPVSEEAVDGSAAEKNSSASSQTERNGEKRNRDRLSGWDALMSPVLVADRTASSEFKSRIDRAAFDQAHRSFKQASSHFTRADVSELDPDKILARLDEQRKRDDILLEAERQEQEQEYFQRVSQRSAHPDDALNPQPELSMLQNFTPLKVSIKEERNSIQRRASLTSSTMLAESSSLHPLQDITLHDLRSSALQLRDIYYTNLLLLGFKPSLFPVVPAIDKDMFIKGNTKAAEFVWHFLFSRLNPSDSVERFRHCWPVYDREQARDFKQSVLKWLEELKKQGAFPPDVAIRKSDIEQCRGRSFEKLILVFTNLVMRIVIERDLALSGRVLPVEPDVKGGLSADFSVKMLMIHIARQARDRLTSSQLEVSLQQEYSDYASELVAAYRFVVKKSQELCAQNWNFKEHLDRHRKLESYCSNLSMDELKSCREALLSSVRNKWDSIISFINTYTKNYEVVQHVAGVARETNVIDGNDLSLDMSSKLIENWSEKMDKDNITPYQNSNVHAVSLIRLGSHAMRELTAAIGSRENLTSDQLPNFGILSTKLQPSSNNQAVYLNTIRHLNQSLRDRLVKINSCIDDLKSSIVHDASLNPNSKQNGLTLVPPTPAAPFLKRENSHGSPSVTLWSSRFQQESIIKASMRLPSTPLAKNLLEKFVGRASTAPISRFIVAESSDIESLPKEKTSSHASLDSLKAKLVEIKQRAKDLSKANPTGTNSPDNSLGADLAETANQNEVENDYGELQSSSHGSPLEEFGESSELDENPSHRTEISIYPLPGSPTARRNIEVPPDNLSIIRTSLNLPTNIEINTPNARQSSIPAVRQEYHRDEDTEFAIFNDSENDQDND